MVRPRPPVQPRPLVLGRLAAAIGSEGGLLAGVLADHRAVAGDVFMGPLAAAGPRAEGREDDVALAVEAVVEGHRLHYGRSRVLDTTDRDLALLAGDRLYALGLALLAEQGDLHAIAELSDVIALSAQAHAAGDEDLADAVWEAGAVAVGWGPSEDHAAAKAAAGAGEAGAAAALRTAARRLGGDVAPSR